MTYGVLTILLGLVIFLATKLTPKNLKGSAQGEEISQDSKKKSAQQQNKVETPENLAQWVLSMEKAKSDLKEKLCSPPVFSGSKILFGHGTNHCLHFNKKTRRRAILKDAIRPLNPLPEVSA